MKDDDDDIQDYVTASGWRKRQVNEVYEKLRNATLEEVAQEFEKMKVFEADTMASIAVHIREMKHERFR